MDGPRTLNPRIGSCAGVRHGRSAPNPEPAVPEPSALTPNRFLGPGVSKRRAISGNPTCSRKIDFDMSDDRRDPFPGAPEPHVCMIDVIDIPDSGSRMAMVLPPPRDAFAWS